VQCPFCPSQDDKVIDSRQSKDGLEIRRRRECEACARRFTTYERVEESLPVVVKKDGRREPFDRLKLLRGLRAACTKRPVPLAELDKLSESVEKELCEGGEGGREVPSAHIGALVLPRLRALDEVAYVRFASIYRSFRDIDEFMSELTTLMKGRP
jgi:transcriptional repressor NrdR